MGHVIDTTSASEILHIFCLAKHFFSDIIGYWWSQWLIHGEPSLLVSNVTDLQYKVIIIHNLYINLHCNVIHTFHKDASIFDSLVDAAWRKTEHTVSGYAVWFHKISCWKFAPFLLKNYWQSEMTNTGILAVRHHATFGNILSHSHPAVPANNSPQYKYS